MHNIIISIAFTFIVLLGIFVVMFKITTFGANPSLTSMFTFETFILAGIIFALSFMYVSSKSRGNDEEE